MRAVCYSRVSSKGQRDKHTVDAQLRANPAFVVAQGWELVRKVGHYVDDGRTARAGHLEGREAFARLLRDAAAGAFDVVVVVDLDRLTRSEDLTERGAVLGAFQRAGVKLAVSTTGQVLDLSSSLGDLFSSLGTFFAAEENRKRISRIKAGKELAIARNRKPAGPTPFGLRYDRATGVWSIDPHEGELIRELFRRVAAGESCLAIANDWNARGERPARGAQWIRERVWSFARSTTYRGQWVADKARGYVLRVPAIVDEDLWDEAQAALKRHNKRGLRKTKHTYLIEDLAVCAVCGSPVGVASGSRSHNRVPTPARYVCTARRRPRVGAPPCSLPLQRTVDVDARVWRALLATLSRDDLLERAAAKDQEAGDDRAAWERDLEEGARRIARLTKAEAEHLQRHRRGLGSAEALEVELAAIARERKQLERQVEAARRALVRAERGSARTKALRGVLADARAQLAAASPEARRHVVRALLEPGSVVVSAAEVVAVVKLGAGRVSRGGDVDLRLAGDVLRLRLVA